LSYKIKKCFCYGFHESRYFTFGEIEIPTKFYSNFVEISIFYFPMKSKFQRNYILILSKFRFRFRNRNFDSYFDFGIGISIPASEFRPEYQISLSVSKIKSISHRNMSTKFLSRLLIRISIPTVKIEFESPITFDNFDQ
jgi:hypothetical protein